MELLKPRVSGWGLAAGVVLGLEAMGAAYLVVNLWTGDPAGELPLILLGGAAATAAIAIGFWRGNRVARWLAIVPGLGMFVVALVFWALTGICTALAGATAPGETLALDAFSCAPEPLPARSLLSWFGTAALAGSGVLVLIGVARPGRVT